MFLAIEDILNWVLPIGLGLFIGYLIATRGNKNTGEHITIMEAEEFRANMRKGQLLDIRKKEDFDNERINGSRNFPKREILGNLFKIRNDQAVFLYADTDKGLVKAVANKLVKKGYKPVYILKHGFEEWPYNKK